MARTKREIIENTVSDMVSDFLYYDRKEDMDLPRGAIEEAIKNNEITTDEIIRMFIDELRKGIE